MKNSQYLEEYLKENAKRGIGNGLTIGSFLASKLRGAAKRYKDVYHRTLENSCERTGAIKGKSARGSVAYYRADPQNIKSTYVGVSQYFAD